VAEAVDSTVAAVVDSTVAAVDMAAEADTAKLIS
jgi:hypothetical protein